MRIVAGSKSFYHIGPVLLQSQYDDALSLVETGLSVTRKRKRTTGHGKNKKQVIDTWDVVGLEGLTSARFYAERGSGSHENKKDFRPSPINALIVLHDPYMENNKERRLDGKTALRPYMSS